MINVRFIQIPVISMIFNEPPNLLLHTESIIKLRRMVELKFSPMSAKSLRELGSVGVHTLYR